MNSKGKNRVTRSLAVRCHGWCRSAGLLLVGVAFLNAPVLRAQGSSPIGSQPAKSLTGAGPVAQVPAVSKDDYTRLQATPKLPFIVKQEAPEPALRPSRPDDDEFEPNDSSSEAGRITGGQYALEGWDQDWFVFDLPTEGQITASIEGDQGDLDLFLFDAGGYELARSVGYDSDEEVSVFGTGGTYTIAVAPYEGQGCSYLLTLDIPVPEPAADDEFEPNNSSSQASEITSGQYELEGWDQDWFVFEMPNAGAITVSVDGPEGDLDLFLFDASGNELGRSAASGSHEVVSATADSGTFLIAVNPYQNYGSSYLLTLDIAAAPPEEPEQPAEPTQPEQPEEPVQPEQPGPPTRRALLVGINHYDPGYGPGSLSGCVSDAEAIRDRVLVGEHWPAGNIRLLTNAQATKSAVREALRSLADQSGPGDVIVYFQSSHGGQSSSTDTYLCMHDASYTDAELGSDLARFESKVVVIVDACHSGGLYKEGGWPLAQQIMKTYKVKRTARLRAQGVQIPRDLGANIGFMTACNYDETCVETYLDGQVSGLFTACLTEACSLSSVDGNGDGYYQFWEVYQYAAEQAPNENDEQTAQHCNQSLLESTVARAVQVAGQPGPSTGSGLDDDDEFEPNDSPGDARLLERGQYNLVGLDRDWFVFEMPTEGQITVSIEGSEGDLDLMLFDPNGDTLDHSAEVGSCEEVSGAGGSGTYTVVVSPYQNRTGAYTLTLDIRLVGNGVSAPGDPMMPGACGAGAVQAMAVGLLGLLGIAAPNRRRRTCGGPFDTESIEHREQ